MSCVGQFSLRAAHPFCTTRAPAPTLLWYNLKRQLLHSGYSGGTGASTGLGEKAYVSSFKSVALGILVIAIMVASSAHAAAHSGAHTASPDPGTNAIIGSCGFLAVLLWMRARDRDPD